MSDTESSGMEAARAAQRRAEEDLARAVGKRPEVKKIMVEAYQQRTRNGLAELLILAFAGKAP